MFVGERLCVGLVASWFGRDMASYAGRVCVACVLLSFCVVFFLRVLFCSAACAACVAMGMYVNQAKMFTFFRAAHHHMHVLPNYYIKPMN